MSQGYVKSLDGVRAIAIILVMTFHAGLNDFGWMGVQLFFVLSGYLITRILWTEKFREGSLSHKFKKFWVRRSLRIFPLYYGFLLVLGITYLLFHFPFYYSRFIPYLATYTFNYTRTFDDWLVTPLFTHMWSLSIEEQFYLFFPMVMFFMPARFIRYFMIAVVVLSPLTRLLLGNYFQAKGYSPFIVADTVYWHTLSHLDAFFMGGLITVVSLDKKIKQPARWLLISFIVALVAGLVHFILLQQGNYLFSLGYGHGQSLYYEHVWVYTLLNLVFAGLILSLVSASANESMRRLFEAGWLVQIGKVSYGMYVFHWAILVYVFRGAFNAGNYTKSLLFFPLYLLVVFLVSAASYYFFELKFIRLKDRWFPSKKVSPEMR